MPFSKVAGVPRLVRAASSVTSRCGACRTSACATTSGSTTASTTACRTSCSSTSRSTGWSRPATATSTSMIEEKLRELGGIKTLISHNYYSRGRVLDDLEQARTTTRSRRSPIPQNVFRDLYTKTCKAAMGRTAVAWTLLSRSRGSRDHPPRRRSSAGALRSAPRHAIARVPDHVHGTPGRVLGWTASGGTGSHSSWRIELQSVCAVTVRTFRVDASSSRTIGRASRAAVDDVRGPIACRHRESRVS